MSFDTSTLKKTLITILSDLSLHLISSITLQNLLKLFDFFTEPEIKFQILNYIILNFDAKFSGRNITNLINYIDQTFRE